MKVKIFTTVDQDGKAEDLEKEINEWLKNKAESLELRKLKTAE